MPPAKLTIVKGTPEETKKPVAGSNWFKPWLKPVAAGMAKSAPKAPVKAKPKQKPVVAVAAKKAPKVAVKAKPKQKPITAGGVKKALKPTRKG
ncbi:MAG: hypothetical protein HYW07_02885 [Candidatus Latescibacteria bacterium]|nr:hypothetical protein [Candidatus Latescibacterota bacterium]